VSNKDQTAVARLVFRQREENDRLNREVRYWKLLFCALARQAPDGELRVTLNALQSVSGKTTFETWEDKATGDRVFRIVPEQSTPAPDGLPAPEAHKVQDSATDQN
jgi:hypothetical protein